MVPSSGRGSEVLGAPSGSRCPERLWGCAGCLWLHGILLDGRDRASGDSALVSLAFSWGTAQPGDGHHGKLGRMDPTLLLARACGPFKSVNTSAQTLSWEVSRTHAMLTNPALAPFQLLHLLSR